MDTGEITTPEMRGNPNDRRNKTSKSTRDQKYRKNKNKSSKGSVEHESAATAKGSAAISGIPNVASMANMVSITTARPIKLMLNFSQVFLIVSNTYKALQIVMGQKLTRVLSLDMLLRDTLEKIAYKMESVMQNGPYAHESYDEDNHLDSELRRRRKTFNITFSPIAAFINAIGNFTHAGVEYAVVLEKYEDELWDAVYATRMQNLHTLAGQARAGLENVRMSVGQLSSMSGLFEWVGAANSPLSVGAMEIDEKALLPSGIKRRRTVEELLKPDGAPELSARTITMLEKWPQCLDRVNNKGLLKDVERMDIMSLIQACQVNTGCNIVALDLECHQGQPCQLVTSKRTETTVADCTAWSVAALSPTDWSLGIAFGFGKTQTNHKLGRHEEVLTPFKATGNPAAIAAVMCAHIKMPRN
jgi:hypothetical protein